ncbi:MAG: sulfatase [Planctomycetales bacterium]|nr:sulfatase [Planctomycetales bacterium]
MRLIWIYVVSVFAFVATTQADDRPNILFAFADDWGRYASKYAELDGPGTVNDAIKTPNFDRIANEGVVFRNAFVTAPSCTPCRSSLLSGQYFFRTGRAAILQGAIWDPQIPSYPLLLRDSGYHIGHTYKVWSPGTPADAPYGAAEFRYVESGRSFNGFSQAVTRQLVQQNVPIEKTRRDLLDEVVGNFESFLSKREDSQPFCYWFGPTNVHRKWIAGSGKKLWGIDPDSLKGKLPKFLPDVPVVREDFADYLGEAMAFDAALGELIKKLDATGELNNTIIVVSGDHGAPGFPRGKCNLYDFGTAVPLAVRWPKKIPAGRVVDDLVNLMDLAPTFLELGNVEIPEVMTGNSIVPLLKSQDSGQIDPDRTWVITGRERHVAAAREGFTPYPHRALRTKDYLYIVNFRPDRWPMGDPKAVIDDAAQSRDELTNNTFAAFADFDASPTKAWLIENRETEPDYYDLAFGKRPREELFVLKSDPNQIVNVASNQEFAEVKQRLHDQLMAELKRVGDPRVDGNGEHFETPPFAGVP